MNQPPPTRTDVRPHARLRRWIGACARKVVRCFDSLGLEQAPGFNVHDPHQVNQLLKDSGVEPIAVADDVPQSVLRQAITRYWKLPRSRKSSLCQFAEQLSQSSDSIAGPLREALAKHPTDLPKRIWELRGDLREAFPLGLAYPERRLYAGWLLTQGKHDFDLQADAVLWYLYELDERPTQTLVDSYLWHPRWQEAVPDALSSEGWPRFIDWLSRTYQLPQRWLRALPSADWPTPQGRVWGQHPGPLPLCLWLA